MRLDSRTSMMPKAVCHRRIALRGAMLAALVVAAVLIVASRGAVTQVEARSAASAQMPPSNAPTSAYVKIEAVGTRRDGATGIPRTLAPFPRLSINQPGTLFLRGGNSEAPGICFTNFGPTPYADYGIQWKFDATVLAIDRGRTTLQVRFMRWRAGNPGAEKEETRTITLAPADTHLLDYVDEPNAAARCANLGAAIRGRPRRSRASSSRNAARGRGWKRCRIATRRSRAARSWWDRRRTSPSRRPRSACRGTSARWSAATSPSTSSRGSSEHVPLIGEERRELHPDAGRLLAPPADPGADGGRLACV